MEQIRSAGPQEEIFKELAALQEISQGSLRASKPAGSSQMAGKNRAALFRNFRKALINSKALLRETKGYAFNLTHYLISR